MVEALLARALADAGVPARVHSAGSLPSGHPASEGACEVMADRGLDLDHHTSTQMSPELVASADLVIALARQHLREVVVLDPTAFARTFTLKELVRRGREVGPPGGDEPLEDWLARLHRGRTTAQHLGASPDDDVADPIGQRLARYRRTAEELDELVAAVAALLAASPGVAGPHRPRSQSQPTAPAGTAHEPIAPFQFAAARSPEETP